MNNYIRTLPTAETTLYTWLIKEQIELKEKVIRHAFCCCFVFVFIGHYFYTGSYY